MESKTNPSLIVDVDVEVDKISVLVEAILHHILSFLAYERVVQTRILPKTWKRSSILV